MLGDKNFFPFFCSIRDLIYIHENFLPLFYDTFSLKSMKLTEIRFNYSLF